MDTKRWTATAHAHYPDGPSPDRLARATTVRGGPEQALRICADRLAITLAQGYYPNADAYVLTVERAR